MYPFSLRSSVRRWSVPVLAGLLIAVALSIHAAPATGGDLPGTKDNPQIKRVTGAQLLLSKYKAFDEMNLPLAPVEMEDGKFKDTPRQHVEGAHTILYYLLPPDVGPFEVVHQYATELKEEHEAVDLWVPDADTKLDTGYGRFVKRSYPDVDSLSLGYFHGFNDSDMRYGSFKGKSANGGDLYVSVLAFPNSGTSSNAPKDFEAAIEKAKGQTVARVDVIETKPMTARMSTVKAEDITDSIAKTGKVAIYGVYFDTDKADLKPESKDALAEMAKAIQGAGAGKKFLIVGHTDNQGAFEHNQALSAKRAHAVTDALAKDYGLPAASVVPVGVGMAAPVASNADDAGRAKNRRVEIVAM